MDERKRDVAKGVLWLSGHLRAQSGKRRVVRRGSFGDVGGEVLKSDGFVLSYKGVVKSV
jgi:hypothetical protein